MVAMLVSLSDSSSVDLRVLTMTEKLQDKHLFNMHLFSLDSRLNFSNLSWGFVGKLYNSFSLSLFSSFTSKQQFSNTSQKQDMYGMLILSEYSL